MKMNLDGSMEVIQGEILPFMCPKCKWAIEYDERLIMVNCFHCKYIGEVEEFTESFTGYDTGELEKYECSSCGDKTPDEGICFMCKETKI